MLSFLLARDTMHQNQWLAAIRELEENGLEETPCPSSLPQENELNEVAYRYMKFSDGAESQRGSWASGPASDGRGTIEFAAEPVAMGEGPGLGQTDVRLHGTPKHPVEGGGGIAEASSGKSPGPGSALYVRRLR